MISIKIKVLIIYSTFSISNTKCFFQILVNLRFIFMKFTFFLSLNAVTNTTRKLKQRSEYYEFKPK